MRKAATLAKITRPQPAQVVARSALFRRLDRARKQPLVWIAGPAGIGKTTLISSYLQKRKLRSIWYQVDAGDEDVAAFFHYLGSAVQTVTRRKHKPLPHLTPEYYPGLRTFTRRYFEELYSRISSPCVLVLDNYEYIKPDALLNQVLRDAVSALPKGINIVVLSRIETPASLARLYAHGEISAIGGEELRLSLEEGAALGKLRCKKTLPPALVQKLHTSTDGWIAGFLLLLEQLSHQADWPDAIDAQQRNTIFDYFASEILHQADAGTQEFLFKTALLPEITAETAAQLSGREDAAQMLADLHRRNYFTSRHNDPRPAYQYHPLFREFLVSRAQSTFGPETFSAMQRSAAKCLITQGRIEMALALLQQSADWETLTTLIIEHAPRWLQEGRNQSLAAWLLGVPQDLRDRRPWLTYWLGVCQLPMNPRASYACFEQAFKLFEQGADEAGQLLAGSGAIDAILFCWDDFTKMDRWISWLGGRRKDAAFPSAAIEARVTTSMAGALVYRQPQHPEAAAWVSRALRLSQHTADANLRMQAATFAVVYYLFVGDTARVMAVVDALRRMARSRDASPLIVTTWKWVEAGHQWLAGQSRGALESVAEGLKIAKATGVHIWDHMLFAEGVYGSLNGGEPAQAGDYLKSMELTLDNSQPHMLGHYHYLAAWYALTIGELPRAVMHAEMALKLVIETGTPFPEAVCRLALAQVYFETDTKKEAGYHLRLARDLISRLNSPFFEYSCLLTEAQFALEQGEEPAARAALAKAMARGKDQGYVGLFTWRPAIMARLYAFALESGIEVKHVQHLIRRSHLALEEPPVAIAAWPWAVKIHTFGQFALELDGKPVAATRRGGIGKPLALLKALIALGGRTVSQSALTEALWPDAEGDSARRAFDTTLHRLRKLLGMDQALVLDEGKLSFNPRYCWVDVGALEQLLAQLDRQRKASFTPEQAPVLFALIERIFSLYRGPFLKEDSDASWALLPREQFQARLLGVVREWGRLYEQAALFDQAINLYQKGLSLDPVLEDLYQRLMRAYHVLGRHAEALATYRRCREILSKVLKVPPSPATEALYKAVQTAQSTTP